LKKTLLTLITLVLLSGCTTDGSPVNFNDGTWSKCTYTDKKGGAKALPLQLGGSPLTWIEPDGTGVDCVGIPKHE